MSRRGHINARRCKNHLGRAGVSVVRGNDHGHAGCGRVEAAAVLRSGGQG